MDQIRLVIKIMLLSVLVGFADSSFLFYKYVTASPIGCLLFDGCNVVSKSPYANVFGVPLPLFGMIFYTIMLISVFLFAYKKTDFFAKLTLGVGVVGFIFSLYFIYLQGFIIQAFCIYCLLSALTTTVLLCCAIYAHQRFKDTNASDVAGV